MLFTSQSPETIAFEFRQISTLALFLPEETQSSLAVDLKNIFAEGEESEESADDRSAPESDHEKMAYVQNARNIPADKLERLEGKLSPVFLTVRNNVLATLGRDPETGMKQADCFAKYLLGDLLWEALFERIADSSELQRNQQALIDDTLESARTDDVIHFGKFGKHEP